MSGFFSKVVNERPSVGRPLCGKCKLKESCGVPEIPVSGRGALDILFVSGVPTSADEESRGHLYGASGDLLADALAVGGYDLRHDTWQTSSIVCRSGERRPTNEQVQYCSPILQKTLKALNPKVIIPLGYSATRAVIGPSFGWNIGKSIDRWEGWHIPDIKLNAWVCPMKHPFDLFESKDKLWHEVDLLWWRRYLLAAMQLRERPHVKVPDYEKSVKLCYSPDEAAYYLKKIVESRSGVVAYDYETNMIKPDSHKSAIYSCAVSWNGERTFAFPWAGSAVSAMSTLLKSRVPKIGANLTFETRWTMAKLGHGVENWAWDGMLGAHGLDNRKGITGMEFQFYVMLGLPPHGRNVAAYLSDVRPDGTNRISEISTRELLLYNGIDALGEYEVAVGQRQTMNAYYLQRSTAS